MNADELDAAREAVSATRTWRDQMRADWGTSFREPEEVLDDAVGELLAERDRLRAVVDLVEAIMTTDETDEWVAADMVAQLRAALDVSPTGEDT